MKCDYGEIRLFTIQSTVSINQGSPDGKGGFLLVYQSKAGSKYGIVVLFSYSEAIWMKTKSTTWGEWKCLNTAEILSNLTTTNKSSLVGAINELNSKASRFDGNIKKVGFRSGQRALNNIYLDFYDSNNSKTSLAFTTDGENAIKFLVNDEEIWKVVVK